MSAAPTTYESRRASGFNQLDTPCLAFDIVTLYAFEPIGEMSCSWWGQSQAEKPWQEAESIHEIDHVLARSYLIAI